MTKPKELRREFGLFQGYNLAARLTDALIDKESIISSQNYQVELLENQLLDTKGAIETLQTELTEQLDILNETNLKCAAQQEELTTLRSAIETAAKEKETSPIFNRAFSAAGLLERERDEYFALSHTVNE